jgi:flagellar motor component MotA
MGDGFPALGIIAPTLDVIEAIASIAESQNMLSKLIDRALLDKFLGIFLAYGIVLHLR